MRCSTVRALSATIALACVLSSVAPAVAQDMTPTLTGETTSWVGAPPPADCVIAPTEVAAIVDALRLPPSESELASFPIVTSNESDLPTGEAPEEDDLAAVSAAMWTAIACINAGDFPRFFACFSPQGINGLIQGLLAALGGSSSVLTEEDLAEMEVNMAASFAATPVPPAKEDQARIDGIRDARVLPDGRILLLVDGALGEDATGYAVFRFVDDRWLIDAIGQIGELPS